jgi:hypothetical protein
LALEQASRVGTQVPEFGHFDTGLESEDTFDAGEGIAITLKEPETEQLVVKTDEEIS